MEIVDIMMIVGAIFLFLALALVFFYFKSDGNACMSNPLSYYQNLTNSVCYCTELKLG